MEWMGHADLTTTRRYLAFVDRWDLKLVAIGDTSSTLSCDTARSVSRVGDRAEELTLPEIHLSAWRHGHRGYAHIVFTFFGDAVLIRPFIAELAPAETAPL